MKQEDKRKLHNQLLAMGLKDLTDPDLIQQLADLVSMWPGDKNQFFVDLLAECDADKRSDMYSAMAPKLRFKPISYIDCEMSINMRASQEVSQGRRRAEGRAPHPFEIGGRVFKDGKFADKKPRASLRCFNCETIGQFAGETPVEAIIAARKAGWKKDLTQIDHEYCPKCELPAYATSPVALAVGNA